MDRWIIPPTTDGAGDWVSGYGVYFPYQPGCNVLEFVPVSGSQTIKQGGALGNFEGPLCGSHVSTDRCHV